MITSGEVVSTKTSIFFPFLRILWQFMVTIRSLFFLGGCTGVGLGEEAAVGLPSEEAVKLSLDWLSRLLVWLGVEQVSSVSDEYILPMLSSMVAGISYNIVE